MSDALLTAFGSRHALPEEFRDTATGYYLPLAAALPSFRTPGAPLFLGINGAQGTGKTTACAALELILAERGRTDSAGYSREANTRAASTPANPRRRNRISVTLSLVTLTLAVSTLLISRQLTVATSAQKLEELAREESTARASELTRHNYLMHIANADRALLDEG